MTRDGIDRLTPLPTAAQGLCKDRVLRHALTDRHCEDTDHTSDTRNHVSAGEEHDGSVRSCGDLPKPCVPIQRPMRTNNAAPVPPHANGHDEYREGEEKK